MSVPFRKAFKTFCTMLFILMLYGTTAQETSPLYFLERVQQASAENPAHQNRTGRLAIGLPLLSGVNLNWNANMAFNYLFTDGFSYSFHNFYNELNEYGKIQAGIKISVFQASIRHNNITYSLSVAERGISNVNFEREIVRLLRDGLMDFYGTDQVLGSGFVQFRHFKEVGIGIAGEIWEGFDAGIRPKLLFGKYYFDTNDFDVEITSDALNRQLMIGIEGQYFMSAPLSYSKSFKSYIAPGDYFFQPRNLGFGLDAGVKYKTEFGIEWAASLIDIGAIGYGHKTFDMKMARPFIFPQEDHYQSHTPDTEFYLEPHEALKHLNDSISFFLEVEDSDQRRIIFLPPKFNFNIRYHLSPKTAIGMANQFIYYKRQPINMVSAFSHFKLGTKFELAGTLSLYNLNELAPGIGASYTARRAQFFMATNNIIGFIYPSKVKHLNLSLGINFLFNTE